MMDSLLKWHGGKHYLASQLVKMQPSDGVLHRVEVYGGSLAWTLAQERIEGVSEVVNDINGDLMNFWRVLQNDDDFEQLARIVECVPFSEVEWKAASRRLATYDTKGATSVHHAADFFVSCRQSRAGAFKDFATLSRNRTRRGMNEQASAWLSCIERLPEVHARLKRIAILDRHALDVIRTQDGPGTLFYLDPPYLHETRATVGQYRYEMTADEHCELLAALCRIKGRFMLSGYRSELYDRHANSFGWLRKDFDLPNNAAGGESKRRMIECVWTNY